MKNPVKTLEQIAEIEFKAGNIHYCYECHGSKKVVETHIVHSYLIVHYDCEHTRTYVQEVRR